MSRAKRCLLFLAIAGGCFKTPQTSIPAGVGGNGGNGGLSGTGGTGAQAGTSGTGGSATAGAGGQAGTGGSATVFVGGPCVVTPDQTAVEVFGRASDGHVYRRAFDGRNWGGWNHIAGLDGTMIDARSDLDCSASIDTIHIVAAGLNPPGALLHAFGFGTSYNAFVRELSPIVATQSPSVVSFDASRYYVAWAGRGQQPALYDLTSGATPIERTPITTLAADFVSGADISFQNPSILYAGFDSRGVLAIYQLSASSAGYNWRAPLTLFSPSQTFAFNPAICAENGLSGSFSINVAAVTGHALWFAGTPRIPSDPIQFLPWMTISTDAASSPDCVVLRSDPSLDAIVHVVALSSRGTIVDVQGNGMNWAMTELGAPP